MSHCFDYSNKRVVITGAFSGVGAALLGVLSKLGRPEVIVLDLKEPDGPIDRFIETNMGDASSVEEAIAAIEGPIDTPLLPDFNKTISEKTIDWTIEQAGGTIATPRDVAMSLAFLGSEASRYVNGVNLNVDMGFSAFMTTGQLDFSGLA